MGLNFSNIGNGQNKNNYIFSYLLVFLDIMLIFAPALGPLDSNP